MPIYMKEQDGFVNTTDSGIAANSLDLLSGATFLKRASGFITQATLATDRIIGVNVTEAAFSASNQTVAKKRVNFVPNWASRKYLVTISGGAVTEANEGSFFNISAADTVNGATVTTIPYYTKTDDAGVAVDPLLTMQLELVRYVSATQGIFRIANL
jgi:hypothetical protein